VPTELSNVEVRARMSHGTSSDAIYEMVARVLRGRSVQGDILIDVGCGQGHLWHYVGDRCKKYLGVDAVKYQGLPPEIEFCLHDLNENQVSLPAATADVVVSVETIEHLENPRAFFRELTRLTKPNGWVIVTTPNQLSFLSLLTLLVKRRFNAFQDVHYPAHITALLEVDLRRIAAESGLERIEVEYSQRGRMAFSRYHYPRFISRLLPRLCSDNILVIGRKLGTHA